jgi:nucleotide-binding universal stress UspA family protein
VDLGELYKKTSEEKLLKLAQEIKTMYPNDLHSFDTIASCNLLVEEIRECVPKYAIDFVVMGTQGASGFKEIFIGSQTMHTIQKSTVPIICVPSTYTYHAPKDIVFATDYELSVHNIGIPLVKDICTWYASRLIFLNAYYGISLDKGQIEVRDALDEYFKTNAHQFQISDGMDVLEAIEDFQSKHKIDLLVMVHNRHNFFENLLFVPVINKIVHHTKTPFLVIPSAQKK